MVGMMRRIYDSTGYAHLEGIQDTNQLITVAAFGLYLTGFIFAFNFFWSIFKGKKASRNPWDATTLEWQTPSPTPAHNFLEEPKITHGPYAYDKVEAERTID